VLLAGASVDLLIEDLAADLEGRSFEVTKVKGGWILRREISHIWKVQRRNDCGGMRGALS
jgi:hypothetical protein